MSQSESVEFRESAIKWLFLSVVVIALDQWSKSLVGEHFSPYEPVPVMSNLNITLSFNTGAAFSFLHDAGGWQRWFFVGLATVVCTALLVWLSRIPRKDHWHGAALALIIGGAVGNVWDRLQLGHVVDFIDVFVGTWHWPAFNVADSAITVGAVILAVLTLFEKKRPGTGVEQDTASSNSPKSPQ